MHKGSNATVLTALGQIDDIDAIERLSEL